MTPKGTEPKRGEVWNVDFDPSVGSEQRKVRPALVLSVPEVGRLPLRIVVPITSRLDRHDGVPWLVPLEASPRNGLDRDSYADAFQIKSLSIDRFSTKRGEMAPDDVEEVVAAVALCIGWQMPV